MRLYGSGVPIKVEVELKEFRGCTHELGVLFSYSSCANRHPHACVEHTHVGLVPVPVPASLCVPHYTRVTGQHKYLELELFFDVPNRWANVRQEIRQHLWFVVLKP